MEIYVIDAGNTHIKLGRFKEEQLTRVQRFGHNQLQALLDEIKKEHPVALAISSVVNEDLAKELLAASSGMVIDSKTTLPIQNAYNTPLTLGMDRLCNAVAMAKRMTTSYGVAIDLGTCIKWDIVGKKEGYLGGSISPGVDLRYKSLHAFTENLPLVSNKTMLPLVGIDTETSMRSGVMNGIRAELEGFVRYYESQFNDLTFFMTGGDMSHFDIQVKNDIFAVENLTLHGLFEIYKHNA